MTQDNKDGEQEYRLQTDVDAEGFRTNPRLVRVAPAMTDDAHELLQLADEIEIILSVDRDQDDYLTIPLPVREWSRITAALRNGSPSSWQPIETAPKDEFILLHCSEDGSTWMGKWQDQRWFGVDDMGLSRQGASFGDPDVVTGWFVTHWMPIPSEPEPHP